jgi:protein phosphatase 2C family protein 2/3
MFHTILLQNIAYTAEPHKPEQRTVYYFIESCIYRIYNGTKLLQSWFIIRGMMMKKQLLLLLLVCGGIQIGYAMENNNALVKAKSVGIFSTKNKRILQEDFFYHGIVDGGNLYAVYDGHYCHRVGEHDNDERDGSIVSKFLSEKFHDYFAQTSGSIEERMRAAFKAVDESELVKNNGQCGSTAAVVFIKDNTAYCAHIGDSRIVLERKGKIGFYSRDHKLNRADEFFRIEDAKGMVWDNRVNGFLAVSRALGDYNLGKKIIIAEPEYEEIVLTDKNKFLVLATNGLWDRVGNEETVLILRAKESTVKDMNILAKLLGSFAITRNAKDNITVMLVDLLS